MNNPGNWPLFWTAIRVEWERFRLLWRFHHPFSVVRRTVKRAVDFFGAFTALILAGPALMAVAAAVKLTSRGPILYGQVRVGRAGRIFTMYKFRSMRIDAEANGPVWSAGADDPRLTPIGGLLRHSHLDELPQLWNVLRGEMSLVGPRPLLVQYLERYSPEQARRHEVPPGITGWAQVNGRNAISWEEKFRFDVWYVDHRTIWLDCRILLLTLVQVFRRHGISPAGEEIMPEFTGSKRPG